MSKNFKVGIIVIILIMLGGIYFFISGNSQQSLSNYNSEYKTEKPQGSKRTVYLFWGKGCHTCDQVKPFLAEMKAKYPVLEVKEYEVFNNKANKELMSKMLEAYGLEFSGVPVTFVGNNSFRGFREIVKEEMEVAIGNCMTKTCIDPISKIVSESSYEHKILEPAKDEIKEEKIKVDESHNATNPSNVASGQINRIEPKGDNTKQAPKSDVYLNEKAVDKTSEEKPVSLDVTKSADIVTRPDINKKLNTKDDSTSIDIPWIGRIDVAKLSIPLVTVILAGVDSFNPCAFFVLFSLLGLLVHAKSRKKMFLIGSIFIFFSGFVYFIFMAAWLNLFLVLGHIKILTLIAGIVSVLIAVINIKDFFFFNKGISLTIPDAAKPKLFDRMRKLIKSTSLPSIVLGTIILAIVANSYELLCTAGFPMVFTRVLTLNNLPVFSYYMYLALYNCIYIIPLAVIVLIFTITLGKRNISEWQGRVLKFVSGSMMLGLGLVLIVDPSILNNMIICSLIFIGAVGSSFAIALLMKNKLNEQNK